jgi:hypothetical protein
MANNQIALLAQAPVLDTPFESQGKALQLRQLMNQGQAADMEMQQKRQDLADMASNRQALQADPTGGQKYLDALAASGNTKAYFSAQKANIERDKAIADTGLATAHAKNFGATTDAATFKLRIDKSDQAIKDISSFTSPEQALASLQQHVQAGDVSPDQAQMIQQTMPQDKAQFPAWQIGMLQKIMAAKDRMSQLAPDANTVANNQTSIATNTATNATSRANNAATQAGENSRAAAGRAQAAQQFGVTQAAGKVPAGYRANSDGTMSFIPGGPADPNGGNKPLTEFQGKSAAFGDRAIKSDKILTELTGNYNPSAISTKQGLGNIWGIGGALESGANIALSENSQKAEQAQRDFINALLRQESGAAISSGEFASAAKQYFPQLGDSQGVIAQKAANRKTAIDGFIRSAGPSAKLQPPLASSQHPPEIESLLKKYGQ